MRENLVMILSHTSTHTDDPTCSVMAGSPQEQYATCMNLSLGGVEGVSLNLLERDGKSLCLVT